MKIFVYVVHSNKKKKALLTMTPITQPNLTGAFSSLACGSSFTESVTGRLQPPESVVVLSISTFREKHILYTEDYR